MKKILFYILFLACLSVNAQFEEHFTDGGFNANPHWDTLSPVFKVINQELTIDGNNNGGIAAFVTADTLATNVEWTISVRLDFNPSDSDFVKIVFISNKKDFRTDFDGYYLKIGQNGTLDGLDFYRRDNNVDVLLKKMIIGQLAVSPNLSLKIKRDINNRWSFYWKNNGQSNYSAIDTFQENTYTNTSFFGMVCNYTTSTKDKFFFDDISAKKIQDTTNYAKGAVLINELMIQPTTTLGLPNKQYIELKNTTTNNIPLDNWEINGQQISTNTSVPANGYVIVCATEDTALFSPFGETVGLLNWNTLNNAGSLILKSQQGEIIDSLTYSETLYQDTIKQKGGWSLELNNNGYSVFCAKNLFWAASSAIKGGTPGQINSTTGFLNRSSKVIDFTLLTSNTLEIDFGVPLNKQDVENNANYTLDNGITIQSVVSQNVLNTKVIITTSTPLQINKLYTLYINTIAGCIGYAHFAETLKIAKTELPKRGELLINEILFNPKDGNEQFIEIYNNSAKVFNLKNILVSKENNITGNEEEATVLSNINVYILPNDYLVLSRDKQKIQNPSGLLDTTKCINLPLPHFDTKEDIVLLKNSAGDVVDKLNYTENWHFSLLNTKQGVSLERYTFSGKTTQDKNNWHSAAKSVGYATPTQKNSEIDEEIQDKITVSPEIFSPNQDGVDDITTISYKFDSPGTIANISVYNTNGILVKTIAKNEALLQEGFFTWDGTTNNGNKADVAIYLIVLETKDVNGNTNFYKHKCAVAIPFN